MLIHELLNKYPDIVPEESPLIVLDIKSAMYMAKNGKNTNIPDTSQKNMNLPVMRKLRSWIGSLIYLLSTRVDWSFVVHKLAKFSENPGKVHF